MSAQSTIYRPHGERYKERTLQLKAWLVTMSNRCTDITPLVAVLAALEKKDSEEQVKAGDVDLQTGEYIVLAQVIADAINDDAYDITIPRRELRNLERVIRLRQQEHDFYAAISMTVNQALSDSDQGHKHFIKTLKSVQEILKNAHKPSSTLTAAANPPKSSTIASSGTESLREGTQTELEDKPHSDADHELGSKISRTVNRVDLSNARYTLDKEADSTRFALFCHLQDFQDVRNLCRATLKKYREGKVSLFYAIMTHIVAFALMHCADDEFCGLHDDLDTHEKIMAFLGLKSVMFEGEPVLYVGNERGGSSNAPTNVVDLVCPTGATVSSVFGLAVARLFRNVDHRFTGTPYEDPSPRELEWQAFHPLIKALFANVDPIRRLLGREPDYELKCFVEGINKYKGKFWVSSCSEAYANFFDAMNDKSGLGDLGTEMVEHALQRILHSVETVSQTYEQHNDYSHSNVVSQLAENVDKCVMRLHLDTSELNAGDMGSPQYQGQYDQIRQLAGGEVSGLERFLPLQAGATTYTVLRESLERARSFVNTLYSIQAMVFVYMAARRVGLIKDTSADLEAMMASYTPDGRWIPELPPNCPIASFSTIYKTTVGADFVALRRGEETTLRNGRPFCGSELAYRLFKVEKESAQETVKTSTSKRWQITLHDMATARHQSDEQSTRDANNRPSFSAVDLLNEFQQSFASEEQILNFDVSELAGTCETLLLKIRDCLMPGSLKGSEVARFILEDLATYQGNGKALEETMLAAASEMISQHMAEHSDDFDREARKRSAGKKHDTPEACSTSEGDVKAQREGDIEAFHRAGTSCSISGKIVALHHSRLTIQHLEKARLQKAPDGHVSLPAYMIKSSEQDGNADQESKRSKQTGKRLSDEEREERKDSFNVADSKDHYPLAIDCDGIDAVKDTEGDSCFEGDVGGEEAELEGKPKEKRKKKKKPKKKAVETNFWSYL